MSGYRTDDTLDNSVDSSIDDPIVRGGSIDFSVDDGFAGVVEDDSGRRIDGSTMIFAAVVVASVLGLWSMRFLGNTSGESPSVETRLETEKWIIAAEENGEPVPTGDLSILAVLDKESLSDLQYGIDRLRTPVPFQYHGEARPVEAIDSTPIAATRPDEQLKDEFESTINQIGFKMKVTAIMAPDTARAQTLLNGFRLTVGDVFDVPFEGREYAFEVERIHRDGVVFASRRFDPDHVYRIDVPLHRDY